MTTNTDYITAEGFAHIQQEFDHLWRVKRPEITRSVSDAAALGDRSENAEYIYGKKQLREIDRRIRFLSRRLSVLKVVKELPQDQDKIFFGAWVALRQVNDDLRWVRIVGTDEFDHHPNYISLHSPLAKVLLGKTLDAEIALSLGAQKIYYWINAITYQKPIECI